MQTVHAGCWPSGFRDLPNLFSTRLSQCWGFSTSFLTPVQSAYSAGSLLPSPGVYGVIYVQRSCTGAVSPHWQAGPFASLQGLPGDRQVPLRPTSQGQSVPSCTGALSWACCQGWAEGTASPKCSGSYTEIGLDLTEGLSSHFTGEDTEAQSRQ